MTRLTGAFRDYLTNAPKNYNKSGSADDDHNGDSDEIDDDADVVETCW